MSLDSPSPIPPPAGKASDTKLIRNIRVFCDRIERGKAAAQNPSVRLQKVLGIASILLTLLGGAGFIVDKTATSNVPGETGAAFWGSVIFLSFGFVSQIANQFQVAKRATASESLAVRCGLYETRLENMLLDEDPSSSVGNLLTELNSLFEQEQYNQILPKVTDEIKNAAAKFADNLIADNQQHWQLKVKQQIGVTKRSPPPQTR